MRIASCHTGVHANTGIGRNLPPKVFCDLGGLAFQAPCDSEGLTAGEHHVMWSILQRVHERQPGTGTANQVEYRPHRHCGRDRKVDGRNNMTE